MTCFQWISTNLNSSNSICGFYVTSKHLRNVFFYGGPLRPLYWGDWFFTKKSLCVEFLKIPVLEEIDFFTKNPYEGK